MLKRGFFLFVLGFDDDGRKFDAQSNMVNWWVEDTIEKFDTKAECFIEQV